MLEKYDDAIRLLKRAESNDPFIEKIYFYLSEVYFKRDEKSLACEYYSKALERNEITDKEYRLKCD
jgi:tetratricopeptide (TPR) repeat protein